MGLILSSLQRVVECIGLRVFSPIVHHLIPSGHQVDTLNTMRYKARASIIPIYIYINTNTFIYMSD